MPRYLLAELGDTPDWSDGGMVPRPQQYSVVHPEQLPCAGEQVHCWPSGVVTTEGRPLHTSVL